MTVRLDDGVWRQLDPSAGRLAPRSFRLLIAGAIAIAALAVGTVTVEHSGFVVPRIGVEPGWDGAFENGEESASLVNRYHTTVTSEVSQTFHITNHGTATVRIIAVDADEKGMRVERVELGAVHGDPDKGMLSPGGVPLDPADPYALRPGAGVQVKIYYDVTDCHAVTAARRPIPVRVQRWFGRQTVGVTLLQLRPFRTGGWSVSTADDPKAVQWQRFLADNVCGVPYPDGL
jgi:hypothetical protein